MDNVPMNNWMRDEIIISTCEQLHAMDVHRTSQTAPGQISKMPTPPPAICRPHLLGQSMHRAVWSTLYDRTERQFFTPERSVSIIREALGPGCSRLDIDVCSVRPWTMNALVADSYFSGVSTRGGKGVDKKGGRGGGEGGMFLVGDAAHQFPPAGGFGLNTGVQVRWAVPALGQ